VSIKHVRGSQWPCPRRHPTHCVYSNQSNPWVRTWPFHTTLYSGSGSSTGLVYLCSACHFAYDGENIKYDETGGRKFGIKDLADRFDRVKTKIGHALVEDYLKRLETDGTPTSSGAFVQICADVIEDHHSDIVDVYARLEALVPIRTGCSAKQEKALQKIADKTGCRADSCSTPDCPIPCVRWRSIPSRINTTGCTTASCAWTTASGCLG
jgi:hypothetical protein